MHGPLTKLTTEMTARSYGFQGGENPGQNSSCREKGESRATIPAAVTSESRHVADIACKRQLKLSPWRVRGGGEPGKR